MRAERWQHEAACLYQPLEIQLGDEDRRLAQVQALSERRVKLAHDAQALPTNAHLGGAAGVQARVARLGILGAYLKSRAHRVDDALGVEEVKRTVAA